MSHVFDVLDVIPQVHIGTEMVTEVASDLLLHFLVSTVVAVATTVVICSSFAPHSERRIRHAGLRPLVGVTSPILVTGVGRWTVFMWVHLIVSV
jgi:hypothetical protein